MRAPVSPAVFNNLSAEEVESIVIRTQCEIAFVKEAYTRLLKSKRFDIDNVLQFALDPLGERDLELSGWRAKKFIGDWMLIEMDLDSKMFVIKDRPTISLLEFAFAGGVDEINAPLTAGGAAPFEKKPPEYDDDDILTATEIHDHFGVPRTTFQSWTERKLDGHKLEPLEVDKNAHGEVTCRFGDFKKFYEQWRQKRQRKKK